MWYVVVITVALVGYASCAGYDGYKIYNLQPSNLRDYEFVAKIQNDYAELDLDFLKLSRSPLRPATVMVAPQHEAYFLELLQNRSIPIELVNSNVGATIAEESRQLAEIRRRRPITGRGRLTTDRYYSHEEINAYIQDLADRYPTRVFVKTVGWSYERRPMKTITITNGDRRLNKKVIFVDAGIHAREWISPAAVLYVIDQLVENFQENALLLQDYDWVILPSVNPDGYEYSRTGMLTRMWRKTRQLYYSGSRVCYGADPNRNFGFHWNEEGASSNPCSDTYAGPRAFSEPEVQVLRDLIHSFQDRGVFYLTLHSYGNYLLYPWGWTDALPDTWQDLHEVARTGADAIREATGTEYTYGSSTNVLYVAAGASDDYAFYAGFNVSITMELPGGGFLGFDPPVTSIDDYVKETWIGIRAMSVKVIENY